MYKTLIHQLLFNRNNCFGEEREWLFIKKKKCTKLYG